MKGVPCYKAECVRIVRAADETLIYQNLKNIDDTSSMDIDTSHVRRQEQHSLSSLSKHVNKVAAAREAVEEVDANERKMRAGDGDDGEKRR